MAEKVNSYNQNVKKFTIERIRRIVKESPDIKSIELISTLQVNEPFLSEKSAFNIVKSMANSIPKLISIDENDKVTLCRTSS